MRPSKRRHMRRVHEHVEPVERFPEVYAWKHALSNGTKKRRRKHDLPRRFEHVVDSHR